MQETSYRGAKLDHGNINNNIRSSMGLHMRAVGSEAEEGKRVQKAKGMQTQLIDAKQQKKRGQCKDASN